MNKRKQVIVDPENVQDAILAGLGSIERGEGTELQTQDDRRRYFEDNECPELVVRVLHGKRIQRRAFRQKP